MCTTLEISITPNQLRVSTSFDSEVMEPNVVQNLLELFHHVLNQLDDAGLRLLLSEIETTIPQELAQYAIATTDSPVQSKHGADEKTAATKEPNPQPMSDTECQIQKVWDPLEICMSLR